MALPNKLKNFNVFINSFSYMGVAASVALPKLKRKTEEFRGAGMNAPVDTILGLEKMEIDHTYAGFMRAIYEQFGAIRVDGVLLRFAGAYQRDDTGAIDAVEVTVRGRHVEIDPGDAKAGDNTDFKVKSSLSYYKLVTNGETVIEIDVLNFIEIINGVDVLAAQRLALGI